MDAFDQPILTIAIKLPVDLAQQVDELEIDYIFDASAYGIDAAFVTAYIEALRAIHSNNYSRILVVDSAYLGLFPDTVVVVPTLGEAHDLIEMERIERDLGF